VVTDDIVTRLRLWASTTKGDHVIEELHRAADEIQRLRNDVKVRDLQILANFKTMDAMHKELYGDAD
jgi:hypothetical protein